MHKFLQFLRVYRSLLSDSRTPTRTKLLPLAALLYVVFPLDFIPDVLPLLGQLDDLTVFGVLLVLALRAVPASLYNEHKKAVHKEVIDVTPTKP